MLGIHYYIKALHLYSSLSLPLFSFSQTWFKQLNDKHVENWFQVEGLRWEQVRQIVNVQLYHFLLLVGPWKVLGGEGGGEGSEDKRTKRSKEREWDREKRKEHKHKLITLIFLTSVAPTRLSHSLLNCDTHIFSACSHLRITATYREWVKEIE